MALAVSKSGLTVVSWVIHLIIVPVAFFYLLRDWHAMIDSVHDLLPRAVEPTVVRLARESDETLSGFVRGQVSVMLVLGAIYAIALWAIGLDIGPLIGIIAGLISFIPYLGGISGILMALIAAIVQYHDWTHVILVLVVFGIGHLLEGYVLVPRLVGEKIGLHPLAVIFAILAGGELFGFLGVLLALPIASVCNGRAARTAYALSRERSVSTRPRADHRVARQRGGHRHRRQDRTARAAMSVQLPLTMRWPAQQRFDTYVADGECGGGRCDRARRRRIGSVDFPRRARPASARRICCSPRARVRVNRNVPRNICR